MPERSRGEAIRGRASRFFGSRWGVILTGGAIGLIGALLPVLGNPPNMGICVVGFLGDFAAGLWLLASRLGIDLPTDLTTTCYSLELAPGAQRQAVNPLSLVRPELIGILLGALLTALLFRDFRTRGGRGALVVFLLGMCGMMGGIIFWGCPIRALLRLAAGDLNALLGVAGLATGIGGGAVFLRYGFNTGRVRRLSPGYGLGLPAIAVLLLVGLVVSRDSLLENRPALMVSLAAGLIIGVLAQGSRFCIMSSMRNLFIMRDTLFASGVVALLVAAFATNLILGSLSFGFVGQPLAHSGHFWNLFGMVVAGLSFTLAGGCPARQLVRSGEGNLNALAYVTGMVTMGLLAHRFGLYPEPDKVLPVVTVLGGPAAAGRAAVVAAGILTLLIGVAGVVVAHRKRPAGRLQEELA